MAVAISPHKRRDLGVLVRWEVHIDGNIYIAEKIGKKLFECASCASKECKHSRLAGKLEQKWEIESKGEKHGRCFFCGRLAPERNGIAICDRCKRRN